MPDMTSRSVTTLLRLWRDGDEAALDDLAPLVYEDLRRIAGRYLRSERSGHTLQTTALVNEAFVKLVGANVSFEDRVHFLAIAARIMRRILTDHARSRASRKRGGGLRVEALDEERVGDTTSSSILDLDDALRKLSEIDERASDSLVLHYFGGMTHAEVAAALGVSTATIDRDLRIGKAWLGNELRNF